MHSAVTTNTNARETPRLNWTNAMPRNVQSQVAIAYSPVRGVMKMYLNGVPVASGVASIPLSSIVDTNCLLGKSQFVPDAYFFGRFNEFRIYSGLLTDKEVAAEYSAGPDVLGVDYALRGYPSSDPTTNVMILSWGTSASNVTLQASPALGSAADWSDLSTFPISQNGRLLLTVPVTNDSEFFRLHTP
jgi:Concanavalin A-like lectin/glucanases superfamily